MLSDTAIVVVVDNEHGLVVSTERPDDTLRPSRKRTVVCSGVSLPLTGQILEDRRRWDHRSVHDQQHQRHRRTHRDAARRGLRRLPCGIAMAEQVTETSAEKNNCEDRRESQI
jgi:hypothetical protein